MATNTQGRRTVDLQTALHEPNILPDIVLVDGNLREAKFLALLNQIPMAPTYNKEFSFYEDAWLPLTDTTAASVSASATTINVTTGLAYIPGHLWKNKTTNEVVLVTSVNTSAGQIDVERGVGRDSTNSTGTAAAAMSSGDTLIRHGPAMGEVSTRQVFQSTVPSKVFNYSQKWRWEVSMSDVQRKTRHITGNDWDYQLDKTFRQARKDLNGAMYIGERNTGTFDGETKWFTGGVDFYISTNSLSVSGILHEYALVDWMRDEGLRYGPDQKTLLSSSGVIGAVTEIAMDKIVPSPVNLGTAEVKMGVSVLSYMSPTGGLMYMTEDRFLTEAMQGDARLLDMEVIRLRHFSGGGLDGRIKLIPNTQDTDADDSASTILGDMGLEIGPEKHHGKMTGVTGGAAGRAVS